MRAMTRGGARVVSAGLSILLMLAVPTSVGATQDVPSSASGQRVVVDPVTYDADIAERDQALLNERLEDGLSRAGFEADESATVRVRTSVAKEEGDYHVQLMVLEGDEARLSLQETCELCGIEELGELLAAMGGRLRRKFDLTKDSAMLRVETRPQGAEVRVDGEMVGTTPVEIVVEPGPRALEVSKPGHRSEKRSIEPTAGARENYSFVLRRGGYKTWLPWVLLGTGVAGIVSGGALIGIDGREIRSDCNADPVGNCQFLHKTLAGGVVLTVVGVGLVATGIVFAVKWRSGGRGYAHQPRFQLTGTGFRGRF
jgi:hypothetical protein